MENLSKFGMKNSIYWGLVFTSNKTYGGESEFEIDYCNRTKMNSNYTFTSYYTTQTGGWSPCSDVSPRKIKIEYDGSNKVNIYEENGDNLIRSIYSTNGISKIGVKCGNAARIVVSNFTFKRKTDFGAALPEMLRASEQIDNKNYSSAISILTIVLYKHKGAMPYYYRARAYIGSQNYKSAIDDCDKGLQYPCEREQRENLYFLRGFSKLMLKDDSGVSDMRQAGEIGMRFLRENDFLDYKTGQKKKQMSVSSSNSKTSIKQSSGRIPALKKTK